MVRKYLSGSGRFKIRYGLSCLIAGSLYLIPVVCLSQKGEQHDRSKMFSQSYPVLHPKFRQWPSPAMNVEVENNPPVLFWPMTQGKDITYDIKLSQDLRYDTYVLRVNNIPRTFYNPHRTLTPGTWYWQYRVHNGKWSDMFQFRISPDAPKKASPPACDFLSSVPRSHPRVLIGKKEQSELVRAARSADAEAILREADTFLCSALPDKELAGKMNVSSESYDAIKDPYKRKQIQTDSKALGFHVLSAIKLFCEAYLLTGDQKYMDKGIAWAMRVAGWDPDGGSAVSDFGDAGCMLAMALAFDTFNGQLTESEKKRLLDRIAVRADRFYDSWINLVDAKVLSNHVWQYILDYFFQTAVAVHGEVKEAGKWLTYAYELWLARAPVLGGEDGGWVNGAPYFRINMETLLDIPMMIKDFTGYDFINSTGWYAQNPSWMYYSFPPGSFCDGFGDNAESMDAPGADYLAYADALSKLTGNRLAATYAHQIEQVEKLTLPEADMLRWFRLRYLMNKTRPAIIPDDSLPSLKVFPDVGVADIHSDISHLHKDLMISMRSSPYGAYGHMLADQNTFNILYGGKRLFYISGRKVFMKARERLEWYKATIGHNGILIDQTGQGFGPENYGWIPRYLNGKSLTYVVGDASNAYRGDRAKKPTGLQYFRRHILFLRPGTVVIYDVLEADHPATWSWLIHSPQEIRLDKTKNRFSCSLDHVSARAQLLASQNVRWKLTDTLGVPIGDWKKMADNNITWNLTAETVRGAGKMRFLTIIQVDPKDEENPKRVILPVPDKNKGIALGNWVIKAEMDTSKSGCIQVYNKDKKVSFTSSGSLPHKGPAHREQSPAGSAKLAEYVNGKWNFQYAVDTFPAVVEAIPQN